MLLFMHRGSQHKHIFHQVVVLVVVGVVVGGGVVVGVVTN